MQTTGMSSETPSLQFVQPLIPGFLHSFFIPKSFLKHLESDLKGNHLQTVVLMTNYHLSRHWVVTVKNDRLFTDGWQDFCLHNELRIGEFLVFTYQSHLLFHVSVYEPLTACHRISSSADHPKSITKTKGSKRIRVHKEAAIPSTQDYSRCVVKLTFHNVQNGRLFLPVDFLRKNGLRFRRCEVLIKDAKKRVWPVNLNYKKSDGQSYINRGWKSFLKANRLKPGDVLSLKFLKGGSCPTFKCYRQTKSGVESKSARKTTLEKTQAEGVSISESDQDNREYPRCQVKLSTYGIKRSIIYFPAHFVRESGLEYRSYEVKVVDEKERVWQVSLNIRRDGRAFICAFICRGWRDVRTANFFRNQDDICFQVLEAGERPTFKCYRCNTIS